MKFYLAGRRDRREEMGLVADLIRGIGHEVTSRWLGGRGQADADNAQYDLTDIVVADALILYTEEPTGLVDPSTDDGQPAGRDDGGGGVSAVGLLGDAGSLMKAGRQEAGEADVATEGDHVGQKEDPGVALDKDLEVATEGGPGAPEEGGSDPCSLPRPCTHVPFAGRGSRHVEFGYALRAGKRLFIVGPRENIFHQLENVIWLANTEELIDRLDEIAPDYEGDEI